MIWDIKSQIYDAAKKHDHNIREYSNIEGNCVINYIYQKYSSQLDQRPLWERLINSVSVQDPDAWKWIEGFVGSKEAILFFNPSDEQTVFALPNGKALTDILSETFNIEFYITNKAGDYLLCFNHHDYLIACGNAENWLTNLR